jgi:hypothetical protein
MQTKTYSQLRVVNFYYDDHLIHLVHANNLMITLFLSCSTNIQSAREISGGVALAFDKLNVKIPEIRAHCQ